jgi:hypothetical protein
MHLLRIPPYLNMVRWLNPLCVMAIKWAAMILVLVVLARNTSIAMASWIDLLVSK